MVQEIKILQKKDHPFFHDIYIDGKYIDKVTSIDLSISPCEIPRVDIGILSIPEFEGSADVYYTAETVRTAFDVMKTELWQHKEVYKAFLSSVESVLLENNISDDGLSEKILKRIIGED